LWRLVPPETLSNAPSYVPVLVRGRDFAAGEMDVVSGMGSKSASRSSAENLTAPAASSDRMASASAAELRADGRQSAGKRVLMACAVQRWRFQAGASRARQPLQPEATGAIVEVTKQSRPSVRRVTWNRNALERLDDLLTSLFRRTYHPGWILAVFQKTSNFPVERSAEIVIFPSLRIHGLMRKLRAPLECIGSASAIDRASASDEAR